MSVDVQRNPGLLTGLRHDLKKWEKHFAAANGGRKPGREDIKQDATVAAKYREYDQLRKPAKESYTVGRPNKRLGQVRASPRTRVLQERSVNTVASTPRKTSRTNQTLQPLELSSVKEEESTPAFIRCALGPTPQKDGQVLGIFDMLPSATPSKPTTLPVPANEPAIAGTPSKPAVLSSSISRLSRTPQSSSKRRYLEAFAGTPLKRKRDDNDISTPSTAKGQYATPSFLRRRFPLAPIEEDGSEPAVVAPPFKKRGLVRSLSSIIQGMRKQEEKRLDDEWDVLNELEAEEHGEGQMDAAPKVLVKDSQAVEMPLGPDQGPKLSDEESDADPGALDANGRPRKVWKKKGLKRQTRRVIMRPVKHKPTRAVEPTESDDNEHEAVGETQQAELRPRSEKNSGPAQDGSDRSDAEGSEYEDLPDVEATAPKTLKQKKNDTKSNDKASEPDEASTAKKIVRKVSAQANANFRKLKIKNKNSKANSRGGRFSRR